MMLVSVTAMSCVFHPRPQVFFWTWFAGTEETRYLTFARICRLTNPHFKVLVFGRRAVNFPYPALPPVFYLGLFFQFETRLYKLYFFRISMHLLCKDKTNNVRTN